MTTDEIKPILISGLSRKLWAAVRVRCEENRERIPALVERALRRELVAGSNVKNDKK